MQNRDNPVAAKAHSAPAWADAASSSSCSQRSVTYHWTGSMTNRMYMHVGVLTVYDQRIAY